MDEQQVMRQRLRAERRKKILTNAKRRMEKLRNVQQWSEEEEEQGVECKAEESEGRDGRCDGEEKGSEEKESGQSLAAEDPPDELLPPPTHPAPVLTRPPSSSPSHVDVWVAALHNMPRRRALLATLVGAAVACAIVLFGYSVPCFLCLLTSELCILLWTLIKAVMSRDIPPAKLNPLGTVEMLKLALALVHPLASHLLDRVVQILQLCGVVVQDLCLGLFTFISITVLCHLIQSIAHNSVLH